MFKIPLDRINYIEGIPSRFVTWREAVIALAEYTNPNLGIRAILSENFELDLSFWDAEQLIFEELDDKLLNTVKNELQNARGRLMCAAVEGEISSFRKKDNEGDIVPLQWDNRRDNLLMMWTGRTRSDHTSPHDGDGVVLLEREPLEAWVTRRDQLIDCEKQRAQAAQSDTVEQPPLEAPPPPSALVKVEELVAKAAEIMTQIAKENVEEKGGPITRDALVSLAYKQLGGCVTVHRLRKLYQDLPENLRNKARTSTRT